MALTDVTTTFNLGDYIGGNYDPRRTKVYLTTNAEKNRISDTSTGEIRLGGGTVTLAANGDVSATTWAPGVDANPASWQTTFNIDYVDSATRQRQTVAIGPFTITTSGLLTALDVEQTVPAEYLTTVTQQLDAKVAEAEAARDAAVDISNISTSDDVVSTLVEGTAGAGPLTRAALSASYVSHLDATGKTSAQINAWLADGAKSKRLTGTHAITETLLLNNTDVHLDAAGATVTCATDMTAFRTVGGQSQSISNLKISNTVSGVRSTYDIEVINPTNQALRNVEVNLPNGSSGAGGIRIYKDVGQPGANYFMPRLDRVWIRNGHLVVDGVTDGKVTDSWFWAPYTGSAYAVSLTNSSSNWTFDSVDVVPPQGDACGYYFHTVENIQINGGLLDGSYSEIMTGWGIKAVNSYRLSVKTSFWNLGRGALRLTNVKASAFIGNAISRCNKADNFYPDIEVIDSRYNTFVGNTHSSLAERVNKGLIYTESGLSTDNVIDGNTMESNEGAHYYNATLVSTLAGTRLGLDNRPYASWPRALATTLTATGAVPQETIHRGYTVFATGTITLTMPFSAAFYLGSTLPIKNSGTGTVTVVPSGADTIEGGTSLILGPGESATLASRTSAAWSVVADTRRTAPDLIVPPATLIALPGAATWPVAQTAIFHRFSVTQGGNYRYANFRVDGASGNIQASVVKLSGATFADYTRTMTSGVVAATVGDLLLDMGATYLEPGEYALAVWCDNTTATLRVATNSGLTAMRATAEVAALAAGVPASGAVTWGSSRYVGGMSLGRTI